MYYADTFHWVAIAQSTDAWHSLALAWQKANPGARFVTTEETLTEVLNWFSGFGPAGRSHAVNVVRTIISDQSTQVIPQTTAGFIDALTLYGARLDKGYSLTDCRSMNAMPSLGISEVLTNDRQFTQEGFTILFP